MRIAVPEVVELVDLVLQNNDVAVAGPYHASGSVRSIRARRDNSTVDCEFGGVDGFLQRTVVGVGDSLLRGGDENRRLRCGILWREEHQQGESRDEPAQPDALKPDASTSPDGMHRISVR